MIIRHLEEISEPARRFVLEARARGGTETTQQIYAGILHAAELRLDRPLLEATKDQLLELCGMLAQERSGRHRASILRMFYSSNDRDNLAKALKIRKGFRKPRLKAKDILDEQDVSKMLESCTSLRDRVLVSVLFDLGGRIRDVLGINLGDLNEVVSDENGGERYYRVELRIQKTRTTSSVLLIDSAPFITEFLERYPGPRKRDAALVWSYVKGRLSPGGAWTLLRKIARRAGVSKPVNPHAFRHARCTSYLRQGLSDAQVKKLMGWSPNSTMLGGYSHLVDSDAEDAKLTAAGKKPPRKPVAGGLIKPEVLRPVVPVQPPAGRPMPETSPSLGTPEISDVQQEVQELRQVAADHGATERVLFEQLAELRAELAALKAAK